MTTTRTADSDGFALACKHCRFLFPLDISVGVMAAHFDTEHATGDVRVELVVVCPRGGNVMDLDYQHGNELHYVCPQCHRTRVVTQAPAGE